MHHDITKISWCFVVPSCVALDRATQHYFISLNKSSPKFVPELPRE